VSAIDYNSQLKCVQRV